jgi:hypothetical protein
MTDLEASVRESIALYVEGFITPGGLSDRLPDGWDLDEASDPGTTDLVMLVVGYLSEYQDGDLTEETLRRELARHAGWLVERTVVERMLTITEHLEIQVRAAAGTEPQEVF